MRLISLPRFGNSAQEVLVNPAFIARVEFFNAYTAANIVFASGEQLSVDNPVAEGGGLAARNAFLAALKVG